MGAPVRGRSLRPATISFLLVSVVLGVLLVAPTGALSASAASAPRATVETSPAASGLSAYATWNGVNVATAANASAAFRMGFGANVTVIYYWTQPIGAAPIAVDDARLQIFYFGFALGTRDITTVGAATSPLSMSNWNTGPLQYVLSGTYMLTASLLATNGSTVWSQSFWVNIAAPYYILALLPIVLILIAIYEVYALCTVGKYAMIGGPKAKPSPPEPAAPAAESGGGSTATPPAADAPSGSTDAGAGTPPTGGAS